MIILDTDHVSILQRAGDRATSLRQRLKESGQAVRTTIVTYEEQMRAWLSLIGRQKAIKEQVQHYDRLLQFVAFFGIGTFCTSTIRQPLSSFASALAGYASQRWT